MKANHSRQKHFNTPKDNSQGLLSRRKYSVMATIFEVFLRRRMGVRYFNGRVFAGTLFGLCLHRIILWCFGKQNDLAVDSIIGGFYYDWFIGLFILLSCYHFIQQRRDQSSGYKYYSHSMGDSRLFFLARSLGFRKYIYITYVFVEPLLVLILAPFLLFYSPYLSLLTFIAAFVLCWENLKVIAHEKQLFLDRQDSEIYAGHVMETMKQEDATAPSISRASHPVIRPVRTTPPAAATSSPSVGNILKNLSPELRSLGQSKGADNSEA